ncbi:MAG: HupE/UreJ family protein [Deltaproteobacteria bacterium]|nr:HupE/UreJ family protein [Deltaproteobacteria bacterium]
MVALAGALLGLGEPARAHQPSQGTLVIEPPTTSGDGLALEARWDVALRDLDRVMGLGVLDADGDGRVLGRELEAARARLEGWAAQGLAFATSGPCATTVSLAGVATHLDGTHAVFALAAACPPSSDGALTVTQSSLFTIDAGHRGLVRLGEASAVLRVDAPTARLGWVEPPGALATLATYVGEGVLHIWEGLDHVLFLLALLLPAVLRWRREAPPDWVPAERLRPVVVDVLKVVTAFTVAHSLTLVLATLGLVTMPSAVVETAIAVSVALAALNNLRPLVDARWTVAFALGLLHGFGFSGVLLELGLPDGARALALFGFNVGVELGQAAIVLVVVPLAFFARRSPVYRWGFLALGSLAIAGLAIYWSVERSGLVGS